jgi:hypothetical protein
MVIFIPYLSPVQAILLVITNSGCAHIALVDINPLYRRLPVLADRTLWRESAALDRADYHARHFHAKAFGLPAQEAADKGD